MFVYRNPSRAERAKIDAEYGPRDWSPFGPASDEEFGLMFLEEHVNTYCDDPKQNAYHTKSLLDAVISLFLEGRPWIEGGREARVQSDSASNYRDPTTDVGCPCTGSRCFSEAGMGKDEGDANCAIIKQIIRRKRNEGNGIESADDLLAIGSSMGVAGQVHTKLKLNRRNEDKGIAGRNPVNRNFSLWTVSHDVITFWEALDVDASRLAMSEGRRALGYGPGISMSIAEFNATQLTQLAPTAAAVEMVGGAAVAKPNPKQRASRDQKASKRKKAEEMKAAALTAAEERRLAVFELKEAEFLHEAHICPRCKQEFITAGNFNRHRSNWCPDRALEQRIRMRERDLPTRLAAADAQEVDKYHERILRLDIVTVQLQAPTTKAEPIGIHMVRGDDGHFRVSSILGGLAAESGQITLGFLVVGCSADDSEPVAPTNEFEFSGSLAAGASLLLTFRRPTPPIPYHGSARKGIHKQPKFKMHPLQKAWLEEMVFKGGEAHMLPAVAWEAMKAKFSDMIRVRTKTPMWLEKDQIAEWLAARKAEEKSRRKNKKALEGGLKKKQRVETPIVKAGAGKKRAAPRPAKRPSKSKAARKADSDSDCDSDGGSLCSSSGSAIDESEAEDSGADSSDGGD